MTENTPRHVQLKLDNCLWCGKPLPDGRNDRRTHNTCRHKVYRYKRKAALCSKNSISNLHTIEERLKYEFSFQDGIKALKAIEQEIAEIYKRHNIVRIK